MRGVEKSIKTILMVMSFVGLLYGRAWVQAAGDDDYQRWIVSINRGDYHQVVSDCSSAMAYSPLDAGTYCVRGDDYYNHAISSHGLKGFENSDVNQTTTWSGHIDPKFLEALQQTSQWAPQEKGKKETTQKDERSETGNAWSASPYDRQ